MLKNITKLIAATPLPILHSLSWLLFLFLFYVMRFRRTTAEKNIKNSFPDLSSDQQFELLKKQYINYCDVAVEILKSVNISVDELIEYVTFSNLHLVEEALQNKQTVMLAVAHQCNQEWALLAASQKFSSPIDGIYKPLHIKWLNELAIESRSRFGITLTPAKTCITDLIKRSKQTRIVAIAADQAPRRRDEAYWTNFLGQDTPFYLGLEKIATLFKYPVFFMQLKRVTRGKYHANFVPLAKPPYDKNSHFVSKRYAELVEKQILEHPHDWLWIHRRWKKQKSLYD